MGGGGNIQPSAVTYIYDGQAWSQGPSLAQAASNPGAAVIKGQHGRAALHCARVGSRPPRDGAGVLYLAGGLNEAGTTVQVYENNAWVLGVNYTQPRLAAAVANFQGE
jgi:hypothetical protein